MASKTAMKLRFMVKDGGNEKLKTWLLGILAAKMNFVRRGWVVCRVGKARLEFKPGYSDG